MSSLPSSCDAAAAASVPSSAVAVDESTLFSPRSTAAMALSSISGRILAPPPTSQQALFSQEQSDSEHSHAPSSEHNSPNSNAPSPRTEAMTTVAQSLPPQQSSPPLTAPEQIIPVVTVTKSEDGKADTSSPEFGPPPVLTHPPILRSHSMPLSTTLGPAGVAGTGTLGYGSRYRVGVAPPPAIPADFLPPPPPWTPPTWNHPNDYYYSHAPPSMPHHYPYDARSHYAPPSVNHGRTPLGGLPTNGAPPQPSHRYAPTQNRPVLLHGNSSNTPNHQLMHPSNGHNDAMCRSSSWDQSTRYEAAPLPPMQHAYLAHQQHLQQHFYPPVSQNVRPMPPHTSVTPTPHKRLKLHHAPATSSHALATPALAVSYDPTSSAGKYNRKHKSLGILADSFLKQLTTPTATSSPLNDFCQEIVIDQIATDLAVERRRVYDVVNILEALQVVVKMGKNTYHWMGREHLSRQFALLQQESIEQWPELALKSGLLSEMPRGTSKIEKDESNKSLTRLSQLFLQVFLVGVDFVSLPEASDLIHGGRSSPEELIALGLQDGDEYPTDARKLQKVAARGLKTKIRRLYDIANVFLSVGLLRKSENRCAPTSEGKRPHFQWNYGLDVLKIRQVYHGMPENMKKHGSPFNEIQESILLKSTVNNPNYSGILTFSAPLSSEGVASPKESSPSSSCSSMDGDCPSGTSTSTPPGLQPPSDQTSQHSAASADETDEATRSRLLRELLEGESLLPRSSSSPARRVSLSNETGSC